MSLGLIPDETLREIESRADIVGLIGRYVELKPAGRNHKGRCPFHDEKTPSFNVSPDRGIFHCFGCGAGGGIFKFLMQHENLTFPEAVRQVAAEVGVEIPETSGKRESVSRSEKVFAALKIAQQCFRAGLDGAQGEPGRRYLESRGLDRKTIDAFGLGYVPDVWDAVDSALRRAGIPAEIGVEAGLLLERKRGGGHIDRLRHRVIFPIQDVRGRVIAFGGRALSKDDPAKYMNTAESPVFQKRRSFYGMPAALEHIRRARRAIVCEGYFDAIAFARAGLGEALATCGTALTPDHGKELARRTQNVTLLFDGDAAGQNAMEKALAVLLPEGLRVRAVALPAGQDPDDYLNERGADALRKIVNGAPAALDVVIQNVMRDKGCNTPDQKADVVHHVAALVALIPGSVERSQWVHRLATATAADAASAEAAVRAIRQGRESEASQQLSNEISSPAREPSERRKLRQLIAAVARCPSQFTESVRAQLLTALTDSTEREVVEHLWVAADEGFLDRTGMIDVLAIEDRLSFEQLRVLREAIVAEAIHDEDRDDARIVQDLISDFARKRAEAEQSELRRRMYSPDADPLALLRERDELLRRKRERLHPSARAQTQA